MTTKDSPFPATLKPPADHPRNAVRPLPYVLLLRFLSGIHLIAAALLSDPPSSGFAALYSAAAPLQLPFQLFLSGFACTYAHAASHAAARFCPTRFRARRFALLFPLHCLALAAHAFAFASSSRALPRALLAALGLHPYLPKSLAFPTTDSYAPEPALIPCLALGYLIFPVLLDVLPRYNAPNRAHLLYIAAGVWCTTLAQAFWLSHLPATEESGRVVMLVDFAVYVPFLAHVPAFVSGMLVALIFLNSKHRSPAHTESLVVRVARVALAASVLLLCTRVLLPLRLDEAAPDGTVSFRSNWVLCGALMPPFAALVWAAASLSDESPRRAFSRRMGHDVLLRLSCISFTTYILSAPVWRWLGFAMCRAGRSGNKRKAWHAAVCLGRSDAPRVGSTQSFWQSLWPWGFGTGDLALTNAAAASASRLTSSTTIVGPAVVPFVYVPVLLVVAVAVCLAIQAPLAEAIVSMFQRLSQLADDGLLWRSWVLRKISTVLFAHREDDKPRRNNSKLERAFRVIVYYLAGGSFLYFVFRFSLPISFHLVQADPAAFFCWLPEAMYSCREKQGPDHFPGLAGLLGQLGVGSNLLTAIVDAMRWISLLTLPTMIINLFGHAIFPRAIWKRLPTVSGMLSTVVEDEEAKMGIEIDNSDSADESQFAEGNEKSVGSRVGIVNVGDAREEVDLDFVLFIRYVTRGNSPRLVASNARRAVEVLSESGLPRGMWRVEVVTDNAMGIAEQILDTNVSEIVVPEDYSPPNGALYKARALNYAITASPAAPMDWIVHLDEETRFDADTIRAILYHCGRQTYLSRVAKKQEWPSIGQGPILYGRSLTDASLGAGDGSNGNWLTTLADSGRVSDDCGRYRIQYECGEVWVGMHGSFVVAANCVEQEITFDHGIDGSIAEDAFFAMLARARDVRFAWIDALMFEQSPFTMMDFVKQRSRWLVGGLRVVSSERIPLRLRIMMKTLTALWALMPLTYAALIVSILFGSGAMESSANNHYYYHMLLPLLAATSLWNYVFGFFVTFSPRRIGVVRFGVLLYLQLILTPLFGMIEVAAVSYALWNFARLSVGFHIVEKDKAIAPGNVPEGERVARGEANEATRLL